MILFFHLCTCKRCPLPLFLPPLSQFIVREREVQAKYQQIISGVSLPAYWLANYAFDVIVYAVPGALAVILIASFNVVEWIAESKGRAGATVAVFAMYGLSVTSTTYLLSWLFKSYSTASNVVLMLNLGASFIAVVAHTVMQQIDSVCKADRWLIFVYRLIPGYNLGQVLLDLSFLDVRWKGTGGGRSDSCEIYSDALITSSLYTIPHRPPSTPHSTLVVSRSNVTCTMARIAAPCKRRSTLPWTWM